MRSPLYKASLLKLSFVNSPLVALLNDKGVSLVATSDPRLRALDGGLFLKKRDTKTFID